MPNYCIFNSQKNHATDLGNLEAEARRQWDDPARYKGNVDLSKSSQNVWLVDTPLRADGTHETILEATQDVFAELGRTIGPKTICCTTTIYKASPEWLDSHTDDEVMAYFNDCLSWEEANHGRVIAAVLHKDETSEHLHVFTVPEIEKQQQRRVYELDANGERIQTGKLKDGKPRYKRTYEPVFNDDGTPAMKRYISASDTIGGPAQLAAQQTKFAEEVGKKYGLERGVQRLATSEDKTIDDNLAYQINQKKQQLDGLKSDIEAAADTKRGAEEAAARATEAANEAKTKQHEAEAARDKALLEASDARESLETAKKDLDTAKKDLEAQRRRARLLGPNGDGINWNAPGEGRVLLKHPQNPGFPYHEPSLKQTRRERDDAKREADTLTASNAKLTDENAQLTASNAALTQQIAATTEELEAKKSEIVTLTSQLDDMNRTMDEVKAELQSRKDELEQLNDDIEAARERTNATTDELMDTLEAAQTPRHPLKGAWYAEYAEANKKDFERYLVSAGHAVTMQLPETYTGKNSEFARNEKVIVLRTSPSDLMRAPAGFYDFDPESGTLWLPRDFRFTHKHFDADAGAYKLAEPMDADHVIAAVTERIHGLEHANERQSGPDDYVMAKLRAQVARQNGTGYDYTSGLSF